MEKPPEPRVIVVLPCMHPEAKRGHPEATEPRVTAVLPTAENFLAQLYNPRTAGRTFVSICIYRVLISQKKKG